MHAPSSMQQTVTEQWPAAVGNFVSRWVCQVVCLVYGNIERRSLADRLHYVKPVCWVVRWRCVIMAPHLRWFARYCIVSATIFTNLHFNVRFLFNTNSLFTVVLSQYFRYVYFLLLGRYCRLECSFDTNTIFTSPYFNIRSNPFPASVP